ncbi:MAG TPA: HEPN domain-containing protein [Mucilaginibacter sp.]|nr:HEPN domain-containing protein [Mucilaginibacter sp.]
MSSYKPDYIAYRLSKSDEALHDAIILAQNQSWNACINRLYYACYYAVSALLLKNDISTHTHAGLKTQFNQFFIKPGKIDKQFGKLYADLMDWRQKGDYGDMFDFDRKSVEPLFEPVEQFITEIKDLLK